MLVHQLAAFGAVAVIFAVGNDLAVTAAVTGHEVAFVTIIIRGHEFMVLVSIAAD